MAAILVAEDEHLTRWTIARALQFEAYEVQEVGNGEAAIYLLRDKNFDAVISDYQLPGTLTGLDVLRDYHQRYPTRPMVLITAQNGETRKQIEAIGGIYVSKPFLLEDLLRIINGRLRIEQI
jgi:CheY-like chemotaxis protein